MYGALSNMDGSMGYPNGIDTIDVNTGEVKSARAPAVLRSLAVGSCVAVITYSRREKVGGLAHVMLPGRAVDDMCMGRTKYAEDAIDDLLGQMKKLGAERVGLEVSLVGGADVIGSGDIFLVVTKSVLGYLEKLGVEVVRRRLGGGRRRSVSLDTATGKIMFTEGDDPRKELSEKET